MNTEREREREREILALLSIPAAAKTDFCPKYETRTLLRNTDTYNLGSILSHFKIP
jgi:hypothetical protein